MNRTHRLRILSIVGVFLVAAGTAATIDGPRGVSPGSLDRVATMRDGCTTFSWQALEGAASYELVAYELTKDADAETEIAPEQVSEVLFVRLPGGVTSWTPEVADCLAPGGRYAWFVRAVLDAETGEATEWSAPLMLTVQTTPVVAEVERALDVLLRYVEDGAEPDGRARGGPDRREIADLVHSARAKTTSRSVQTGTAAIRGEQPDPTGETYGVVGTSAAPDGAGLGAVNTAGGPDLVLDGSAAGAADAEFSEAGVDRPSASPQAFTIGNSGGGGMTLDVDGVEVVTTATDQDTVGALSCAPDEIAKFIGGVWVCAPDVDTNTDTLGSLMCSAGQVAKWTGSVWVCAPDLDTLAALSCSSDEVAKWTGSIWTCAPDDDTRYSAGPGVILDGDQARIDPALFSKRVTTLDSAGDVGFFTSLAIGADGFGLVAYYSASSGDLKVAHCGDSACTTAALSTIDSLDPFGNAYTSMAIGADGFGVFSYYDEHQGDLRVAHCNDPSCTSATITILDSNHDVGVHPSMAIGADGLGLISYYDASDDDLNVAHCNDVACASASFTKLDTTGNVGPFSSVAIGADGLALISYVDITNNIVKVAHCNEIDCVSATLTLIGMIDPADTDTALAIGADGLGLIAFHDDFHRLRVFHCGDTPCTTGRLSALTPGGVVDEYLSLAVGGDGLGIVIYRDSTDTDLKAAHCINIRCTGATITTIDIDGVGDHNSIAIGLDGLPLVSYLDNYQGDLKVAHLPYGW